MCAARRDAFLKEAQFWGVDSRTPLPWVPDPPPPHGSSAQLVSQCVYPRPAVKICGYPELPSILCFIRLSCDSFSYQDQPDVSQPMNQSCLATPSWTRLIPSWTNHWMRLIHSQISQALPYSQILVKLCPALALPNKLV